LDTSRNLYIFSSPFYCMDIEYTIDYIVSILSRIFNFIVEHPQYVVIILAGIILYAIINHLVFRLGGFQPREKTMCVLSMMGKERSLDYLRTFTHMPSEQVEIIKYLRKNEPVSLGPLGKRFGKHNVELLIRQEYIILK
jgi:hypothetical protein